MNESTGGCLNSTLNVERCAVLSINASYSPVRFMYFFFFSFHDECCMSDILISDTGAPQGTVLSPLLFILYTADVNYCTGTCHLQKYSDDSAVIEYIASGEESEHKTVVDNFVTWSESNYPLTAQCGGVLGPQTGLVQERGHYLQKGPELTLFSN